MATVFVNMGSNLGNRKLNLSRGMRAIGEAFGNFELSHVVESAPWGFDSTHSFLNVGMAFETELSPREVLETLQKIEKSICKAPHRDKHGGYVDRIIDIDIVAIDDMLIDETGLKVPHPELTRRRFFLEPMQELGGLWRHPATGLTPGEMLENLCDEASSDI